MLFRVKTNFSLHVYLFRNFSLPSPPRKQYSRNKRSHSETFGDEATTTNVSVSYTRSEEYARRKATFFPKDLKKDPARIANEQIFEAHFTEAEGQTGSWAENIIRQSTNASVDPDKRPEIHLIKMLSSETNGKYYENQDQFGNNKPSANITKNTQQQVRTSKMRVRSLHFEKKKGL